ncbi:hypothetical protein PoB_002212400 [Plakobranchus ocellatus]|uniref:Uncharacterized protein n=1 Tax=Plakobranchus ocellatus TaxID=259542 RepID=A0AAV3ZP12_9GAST|nr:hypothetical protein PoB_002212400 [Plakobranchus ocellatus]
MNNGRKNEKDKKEKDDKKERMRKMRTSTRDDSNVGTVLGYLALSIPFLSLLGYVLYKAAGTVCDNEDIEAASLQKGDLRLLGPPTGQGAGSGARIRGRRVPVDLRVASLTTVPPTPPTVTALVIVQY